MSLKLQMQARLDATDMVRGAEQAKASLQSVVAQGEIAHRSLQDNINRALIAPDASAGRARQIEEYGRQMDALRARFNPLFAVQQRYTAELADIRMAHRTGAISADEMAAAVQRTKAAFAGQVTAMRGVGTQGAQAVKLATHEVTNLSYQANDIAVMLASGQSPFLIMMQQGMQVSQIMGRRGLGQILPALAQGLMSLISPTTLLLAGVTAVGYGASMVFSSMREEVRSTEDVLAAHDDTVRRLKDAWEVAQNGRTGYADSLGTLRYTAKSDMEGLRAQIRSELATLEDDLWRENAVADGLFSDAEKIPEAFMGVILSMREEARKAQPDVRGLREEIVRIAEASDDPRQRAFADRLLVATNNAAGLTNALYETGAAMGRLFEDTEALSRAMDGLEKLGSLPATAQDRARSFLQEGLEAVNPQDVRSRRRLLQEYEQTLERISQREAEKQAEQAARQGASRARSAARSAQSRAEAAARQPQRQAERDAKTRADYLDSLDREEEQLAITAALIGAGSTERARAMALMEAEIAIREKGFALNGPEADAIRDRKIAMAELNAEIERQAAAYAAATDAGRSMIDDIAASIRSGDLEGLITSLTDTLLEASMELGFQNPLKNMLYGDNLPTFGDFTGFGGFFAAMAGRDTQAPGEAVADVAAILGQDRVTGQMNVQAATVMVNGGMAAMGGGAAGGIGDLFKSFFGFGGRAGGDPWAGMRQVQLDTGGATGFGGVNEPAGIVHRREHVVRAPYAERYRRELTMMNKGQWRGYDTGGLAGASGAPSMGGGDRKLAVSLINNGEPAQAEATMRPGADGDVLEIVLERVGVGLGQGRYDEPMKSRYRGGSRRTAAR